MTSEVRVDVVNQEGARPGIVNESVEPMLATPLSNSGHRDCRANR